MAASWSGWSRMTLTSRFTTYPFQRTFTLPVDADMKALKAKLEDGLLRIDLPKRDMSGEPKVKFQVE
jgi:HSP20 family molecular chaperone IbpA